MLNCRYVCVLLMSFAVPACAGSEESPLQTASASVKAGTDSISSPGAISYQKLPDQWESFTHSEWLDALDIASCEAESQGSEARRKNWVQLDDSTQLLLLTCGLGAYQDAFHVYAVNAEDKTVVPVTLRMPRAESEAGNASFVRGSLYKGDQDDVVELLYLSAATGSCGWRALYPVDEVKRGGPVEPKALFGDEDCYNGVTVENWPRIESGGTQ